MTVHKTIKSIKSTRNMIYTNYIFKFEYFLNINVNIEIIIVLYLI